MQQAIFVKDIRFVQKPVQDCLFESPKVANLPFGPFVLIDEQTDEQIKLMKEMNLSSVSLPEKKDDTSFNSIL